MFDEEGCIIQLAIIATILILIAMCISWGAGIAIDILRKGQEEINEIIENVEDIKPPETEPPNNIDILPPPFTKQLGNCAKEGLDRLDNVFQRFIPKNENERQTTTLALSSQSLLQVGYSKYRWNQPLCVYTSELSEAGNLTVGGKAVVQNTIGQGLACRVCPGKLPDPPEKWLANSTVVIVKDGPVSVNQDDWLWWQVETPDQTLCWVAEEDWLKILETSDSLESEDSIPVPLPPPAPQPPPPQPPPEGWCRAELIPRDLGTGELCNQEYFVDFMNSSYPGHEARIFYLGTELEQGVGKPVSYWRLFNDRTTDYKDAYRWGVSTFWSYKPRNWGWKNSDNWIIEYPCDNVKND